LTFRQQKRNILSGYNDGRLVCAKGGGARSNILPHLELSKRGTVYFFSIDTILIPEAVKSSFNELNVGLPIRDMIEKHVQLDGHLNRGRFPDISECHISCYALTWEQGGVVENRSFRHKIWSLIDLKIRLLILESVGSNSRSFLGSISGCFGESGLPPNFAEGGIHSTPLSIRNAPVNGGGEKGGNSCTEQANLNSVATPPLFISLLVAGIVLVYKFAWELIFGEYPKMWLLVWGILIGLFIFCTGVNAWLNWEALN
jgi:hypothetical protein